MLLKNANPALTHYALYAWVDFEQVGLHQTECASGLDFHGDLVVNSTYKDENRDSNKLFKM